MEYLSTIFPLILYFLLIILVVVLIVLFVRLLNTLRKIDNAIDNINARVSKLDGVFNIVDIIADSLSMVSNKLVSAITNGVGKIFSKNKKKKEDEEDE